MRIQILVLKYGWLIVVFEQGRQPTYYKDDWLDARLRALLSNAENLTNGLPVDAVSSHLLAQGFTLSCRMASRMSGP